MVARRSGVHGISKNPKSATPGREVVMNERELREDVATTKECRGSRRAFMHKMVALGLSAPLATRLLAHTGLAQTPTQTDYKPTKAGGGGALKMLFWQGPTFANPHFCVGPK